MAKKPTKAEDPPSPRPRGVPAPGKLLKELRDLILAARGEVAQAVNSGQVVLYWQVGHRLRTEVLGAKRAGYGERIVAVVAARLTAEFGRGFTDKNLRHMIRFAETFPDREIVYALSRQLSWTQFRYEKEPGEESPLGLILCAGKSEKHVELLQLDRSG